MDLLEEIIKNSNVIPNKMWEYFIPLITSVIGTDEELEDFKKEYPNQIYEGNGFDSINSICKLIKIYIAKDPNTFINSTDNKGKKYIDYLLRLVQSILEICEGKNKYVETKNAFDETIKVEKEALKKYNELRNALLEEGIDIELDSVYRSVSRQEELWKEFEEEY
jgi:hypothetical protein